MKRISFLALILAMVFIFSSCGRIELYQNLTEEEANEILVLLSENSIKAEKKKETVQNEVSYAIAVSEKDMTQARSLLLSHNLPRRRELGLTGVYKDKGLIPTPDEQKARFLLALKGEIINSLEKIPQVVDADVVLNIPTKDEFANADRQKEQRPTASIVVKAKPMPNGDAPITEAKVQQFVANAVEGLNPRDVSVVISFLTPEGRMAKSDDVRSLPSSSTDFSGKQPVAEKPAVALNEDIIGLKLDAASKNKLKIYLLIFFVVLILLSAALILSIVQASRSRRKLMMQRGHAGNDPAIEGRLMDDGPPELPSGEE